MKKKSYLAVDMGASSGRHVVGHFDGQRLELEELFRFENGPTEMLGSLYWDLPGLWNDVQQGLVAAGSKYGDSIISVGVDTWGVDFLLVGPRGEFLGFPYCYRDPRTDGMMEQAFQIVPRSDIFAQTGLQFMQFNSLYQLLAMKENHSPFFDRAERLLMMPDLFHWLLSGVMSNEFTNATTTQCFDPQKNDWSWDLLQQFGLPAHLFHTTSAPGTVLGSLLPAVSKRNGLTKTKVVLPGSHDTASAVMAVPTGSQTGETNWAYISLGTWALMGIESPCPIVNETVAAFNFTNEGGVGSTTRVLKNICGLWLIQECRRTWNEQEKRNSSGLPLTWEDIAQMTAAAPSLTCFIAPDARDFLAPTDMPEAIRRFAARTGQRVPEQDGTVARVALESIAMKFRQVLRQCQEISGQKIETVHIVGGGTRNTLLCQAAADATGCRVVTGPIEATAIGNIMMQAVAAGDVADIHQARAVIRHSFEVVEYEPHNTAHWDDAYERFLALFK